MVRRKRNRLLFGIGIFLLLATAIATFSYVGFVQQTAFESFTGNVVLPLTAFYECEAQFPVTQHKDFQDSGFFVVNPEEMEVFCGRGNVQGFFPEGCDYSLNGLLEYNVCDVDDDTCDELTTFGTPFTRLDAGQSKTINIKSNQKMALRGFDGSSYDLSATPFALEVTSPTSGKFVAPSEDQCSLIERDILFQLDEEGRVIDFDRFELKPQDAPINVVVGGISVTDPKNVIFHPTTGEVVYVKQFVDGIKVCETFVQDGLRFVNLQRCEADAEIFCLPQNPACSDSGNDIVDNPGEGKSCSELTGIIDGFVPVSATERCLIQCVDGTTQIDNDNCVTIETSSAQCPSDRPFLIGNKCVSASTQENTQANVCENEGGTWVQRQTSQCGFLCSIGLGQPDVTTDSFCKQPNTTLIIILVISALIIITILLTQPKKVIPPPKGGTA